MDLDDKLVYSWKEYAATDKADSSPVGTIDVDDTSVGGLISGSADTFSCCISNGCTSGCTF